MPKVNIYDYQIEESKSQSRRVKMNAGKKIKKMK